MMDEERREHVQKMKKMEAEMEQVFELKVKEKMQKLKDSENDVSVKAFCLLYVICCRCYYSIYLQLTFDYLCYISS